MVADTQSIVVGGTLHNPSLDIITGIGLEEAAGVGVTCRRDGTLLGIALADNELERARSGLGNAEHGDGTLFKFKLNTCTAAGFAVELCKTTQNRLAVGDCEVVRTIVTDENKVFLEIEGMELLQNTDMPVAEISEQVGFADYNHFLKYFKRVTGYTTKAFRVR